MRLHLRCLNRSARSWLVIRAGPRCFWGTAALATTLVLWKKSKDWLVCSSKMMSSWMRSVKGCTSNGKRQGERAKARQDNFLRCARTIILISTYSSIPTVIWGATTLDTTGTLFSRGWCRHHRD